MTDAEENFESLLDEAAALIDVKRYPEAIERARTAVAMNPTAARPYGEWSRALYGEGNYSEAATLATQTTILAPNDPWGFRLLSSALYSLARASPKAERTQLGSDAVAAARESLRLAPNDVNGLSRLAQALSLTGAFEEADDVIREVIRRAPNSVVTWVTASLIAIDAKNWSAAIAAGEHALTIEPNNYAALNNLGVALRASGRKREGTETLARAASAQPDETMARRNLSRAGINAARVTIMIVLLPLGFVAHLGTSLYFVFAIASNVFISKNPAFVLRAERWAAPVALFFSKRPRQSSTARAPFGLRSRRSNDSSRSLTDSWSAIEGHYRIRTSIVRFMAVAAWLSAAVFLFIIAIANNSQRIGLGAIFLFFVVIALWPTRIARRRSRNE